MYYINHIISLRGEAWCHIKSLTLPLFIEVFVPNQKVSIMYLCSRMSTSSVLLDFRTCLTIWYLFYFFLSETVLIHEVLVVEVTLKVCVKRQSHTSKSSRFIFNWCKICSFVSNVILLTPSPLFYHNTIIWSSTNWCDLKSVQLYALRYSFKSVKLYVIIFCHAWLILEWHYVQLIIVYIPESDLHGLQAMSIYVPL